MRLLTLPLMVAAVMASAQASPEAGLLRIGADVRVDWQNVSRNDRTDDSRSGFQGKYFMLRADGNIGHGVSYSWRQRLNKRNSDVTFFDATDWAYVNYSTGLWNFQGGKQMVMVGGWEYDARPIDLYACSVFWNNVNAFEMGVSASYAPGGIGTLTAQISQSPFFDAEHRNMYAYNLMWSAAHGVFHPIWSVNMIEYRPGHWINYIALGNRFELGKVTLTIDLTNRAASGQGFLLKDCTVTGELGWRPVERLNIWGKMTYDVNRSGTDADLCVLNGTEMKMAALGAEFHPLRNARHALRLHADVAWAWGRNANAGDLWQNHTLMIDAGVTWNMDFFNIRK